MTPTQSTRPIPEPVILAVALALGLAGLASGCSKDTPATRASTTPQSDAAATAGDTAAPATSDTAGTVPFDLGGKSDTPPPPTTCASLRNCITRCTTDTTCQQRCLDAAPPAARTRYAPIAACSKMGCPDFSDDGCRCERECMADGACSLMVDECRELEDDVYCDGTCGS